MKKRVLLTLCGFAALAAAIVCLPVSLADLVRKRL